MRYAKKKKKKANASSANFAQILMVTNDAIKPPARKRAIGGGIRSSLLSLISTVGLISLLAHSRLPVQLNVFFRCFLLWFVVVVVFVVSSMRQDVVFPIDSKTRIITPDYLRLPHETHTNKYRAIPFRRPFPLRFVGASRHEKSCERY